jgi:hypothetical protein
LRRRAGKGWALRAYSWRSRPLRMALSLVAVLLMGLLVPLAGAAAPAFATDWTPTNAASHKCLDADANHITSNGDTVQLWDCWYSGQVTLPGGLGIYNLSAPNQSWA